MSDEFDYRQIDREVAENMKGQTFLVTIRNRPDDVTPDDIKTELTYNENDLEPSDVDVERISLRGGRKTVNKVMTMITFTVEDAA